MITVKTVELNPGLEIDFPAGTVCWHSDGYRSMNLQELPIGAKVWIPVPRLNGALVLVEVIGKPGDLAHQRESLEVIEMSFQRLRGQIENHPYPDPEVIQDILIGLESPWNTIRLMRKAIGDE